MSLIPQSDLPSGKNVGQSENGELCETGAAQSTENHSEAQIDDSGAELDEKTPLTQSVVAIEDSPPLPPPLPQEHSERVPEERNERTAIEVVENGPRPTIVGAALEAEVSMI